MPPPQPVRSDQLPAEGPQLSERTPTTTAGGSTGSGEIGHPQLILEGEGDQQTHLPPLRVSTSFNHSPEAHQSSKNAQASSCEEPAVEEMREMPSQLTPYSTSVQEPQQTHLTEPAQLQASQPQLTEPQTTQPTSKYPPTVEPTQTHSAVPTRAIETVDLSSDSDHDEPRTDKPQTSPPMSETVAKVVAPFTPASVPPSPITPTNSRGEVKDVPSLSRTSTASLITPPRPSLHDELMPPSDSNNEPVSQLGHVDTAVDKEGDQSVSADKDAQLTIGEMPRTGLNDNEVLSQIHPLESPTLAPPIALSTAPLPSLSEGVTPPLAIPVGDVTDDVITLHTRGVTSDDNVQLYSQDGSPSIEESVTDDVDVLEMGLIDDNSNPECQYDSICPVAEKSSKQIMKRFPALKGCIYLRNDRGSLECDDIEGKTGVNLFFDEEVVLVTPPMRIFPLGFADGNTSTTFRQTCVRLDIRFAELDTSQVPSPLPGKVICSPLLATPSGRILLGLCITRRNPFSTEEVDLDLCCSLTRRIMIKKFGLKRNPVAGTREKSPFRHHWHEISIEYIFLPLREGMGPRLEVVLKFQDKKYTTLWDLKEIIGAKLAAECSESLSLEALHTLSRIVRVSSIGEHSRDEPPSVLL
eukprot:GHVN01069280.1.p1 GENE.GHVN01069280.1~~GHVN01069280.1.p1  ORF type:complete len:677 (-),score=155.87 GHVN01069280.1:5232-7142(-)